MTWFTLWSTNKCTGRVKEIVWQENARVTLELCSARAPGIWCRAVDCADAEVRAVTQTSAAERGLVTDGGSSSPEAAVGAETLRVGSLTVDLGVVGGWGWEGN